MAVEIAFTVPLPPEEAMALLLRAAEALQHHVVRADVTRGVFELHDDFSLRALSTFRIHAQAQEMAAGQTSMRLRIRPAFRLTPWAGYGQSERVGWRLVGKMQEILDPKRYRRLADADLPSPAR